MPGKAIKAMDISAVIQSGPLTHKNLPGHLVHHETLAFCAKPVPSIAFSLLKNTVSEGSKKKDSIPSFSTTATLTAALLESFAKLKFTSVTKQMIIRRT